MFSKKTIRDVDVAGKTVLVRVDFNVPMNDFGVISDDYRLRQTLPTIEYLRGLGAKIVIMSHLGRPKSKDDASCSLAPVAKRLADLMHVDVKFVNDCIGSERDSLIKAMKPGDILLLENVRFYPEEEANDATFAKNLAKNCDVFVQECFGVSHRNHASIVAITKILPSYAGLLLVKEVETITNAIEKPARPLVVVIGGAKITDKIEMLEIFIEKADYVAAVGALANTLLLAQGYDVGKSLVEPDAVDTAKRILQKANNRMQKEPFTFYLPQDVVVSTAIDNTKPTRIVDIGSHTWADITSYPKQPKPRNYTVQLDELILDVGPITSANIAGAMKLAKTAIWSGTAGVTETKGIAGAADPYSHGSLVIADALAGECAGAKNKPFTVVGGGDTVGFVESVSGLRERLNHVSTGGGASLELMAGKKLPGVEALLDK